MVNAIGNGEIDEMDAIEKDKHICLANGAKNTRYQNITAKRQPQH